jgi:hypothetical protein
MSHLPTLTASTIITQVVGCAQGQMSQGWAMEIFGPRGPRENVAIRLGESRSSRHELHRGPPFDKRRERRRWKICSSPPARRTARSL